MNNKHLHNQAGFALIITLWILVLLITAGIAFSRMARLEVRIAKNNRDALKARYLAKAGVVQTAVVLEKKPDIMTEIEKKEAEEEKQEILEKYFQGLYLEDEPGQIAWEEKENTIQITCEGKESKIQIAWKDEESKININKFREGNEEILEALPGFDEDIVASILDWMDKDDFVKLLGGAGAENPYYQGLDPPYACKNGPLDVPEELLLIKGITPLIYWGEDANNNGILDPNEDDGEANFPPDNADGVLDSGVKDYVTTFTGVKVNFNTASLEVLTALCEGDRQLAGELINIRESREGKPTKSDIKAIREILSQKAWGKLAFVESSHFRIIVTGELKKSKVRKTIETVVKMEAPVHFLLWKEH